MPYFVLSQWFDFGGAVDEDMLPDDLEDFVPLGLLPGLPVDVALAYSELLGLLRAKALHEWKTGKVSKSEWMDVERVLGRKHQNSQEYAERHEGIPVPPGGQSQSAEGMEEDEDGDEDSVFYERFVGRDDEEKAASDGDPSGSGAEKPSALFPWPCALI